MMSDDYKLRMAIVAVRSMLQELEVARNGDEFAKKHGLPTIHMTGRQCIDAAIATGKFTLLALEEETA